MAISQEEATDHTWAEHLIYLEAGADLLAVRAPEKEKGPVVLWGLLLAVTVALGATGLSTLPVWPLTLGSGQHPVDAVMLAILIGMVLGNLWTFPAALRPGIRYAMTNVLKVGIVLLGARLYLGAILHLGLAALGLSLLVITVALLLLFLFAWWLRLPPKLATLLGVGTAICGGSAIVATAPVIEAEEKDVAFSIATVTLLGFVAMVTLPLLGHFLDLSDKSFGIWAGLAIHQTPQVVASGFAYSEAAGEIATVVKLARVCLLAPIVLVIGVVYARSKSRESTRSGKGRVPYWRMFPVFVLGFLLMALLRTVGWLPDLTLHLGEGALLAGGDYDISLPAVAKHMSKFLIVTSMAGVGLETKLLLLKGTGHRPFVAAAMTTALIGLMVIGLVSLFDIS